MKTVLLILSLAICLAFVGCNTIRPAPTEAQKQNAWLLKSEARLASNLAITEDASGDLKNLTSLTADDAENVTMYFGAPKNPLPVKTVSDVTSEAAGDNRDQTKSDAARKVGPEEIVAAADEGLTRLEAVLLALGIGGTASGVWITRLRNALKAVAGDVETKDAALVQIVRNNQTFLERAAPELRAEFRDAQGKQTAATKEIVTDIVGNAG